MWSSILAAISDLSNKIITLGLFILLLLIVPVSTALIRSGHDPRTIYGLTAIYAAGVGLLYMWTQQRRKHQRV